MSLNSGSNKHKKNTEFSDSFEVKNCPSGERIDVFLSDDSILEGIKNRNTSKKAQDILKTISWSRSYIKKLIKKGAVKVNEEYVEKSALKVKNGDLVDLTVILDDSLGKLVPEKMKLDVEYEDEDILYINKPSGMVVHPGAGNPNHTLANGLLWYLNKASHEFKGEKEYSRQVGLVHRLDKDTSGGICIAKDKALMSYLMSQFENRKVEKYYIAICYVDDGNHVGKSILDKGKSLSIGQIEKFLREYIESGKMNKIKFNRVETLITRSPSERIKMAVRSGKGRKAITHWSILGEVSIKRNKFDEELQNRKYVFVVIKPKTGRLHQIRVHLKYKNIPILGDPLYGKGFEELKFMCLHSFSLGFPSVTPKLKERLPKRLFASIPQNWSKLAKKVSGV